MEKLFTTRTAGEVLGLKPDSVKHLATIYNIGAQPGGPGTPHIFTAEDLKLFSRIRKRKWKSVEEKENLGLLKDF